MSALQTKLESLYASLTPDEQALVEGVDADAGPEQYPPELWARLQAMADELTPAERASLAGPVDDVEGFMISQPRVAQPGSFGHDPPGGGGTGFDPINTPEVVGKGVRNFHRGLRSVLSGGRV